MILLGLLLANLALYHGACSLGFLSVDDPDYVQNNPYIEHLTPPKLKHILTRPYAANYAPANLLSYALDVAIAGGKSACAMHNSSVLWHSAVVGLVYLLGYTMRANLLTAAAGALLFLLHPAHVEVVAWVSSRKDLVATGFALLAMTCYLQCRRKPERYARVGWYGASLCAFLLASAGKQSVLLLPLVMLIWDVFVERRKGWRMFADKVPFGLITIFFGWMTWQAQPSTNQAHSLFVLAAAELTNLWLLTGLGQYTLYREAPDPAAWSRLARLLIIASAMLAWVWPWLFCRFKQPVRLALASWVLIQMIPPLVLSFLVPVTDRYLFLPSVGVCILVADVLTGAGSESPSSAKRFRARGWLSLICLLGLATVWGAKTWRYYQEWHDPRSVWYGAHLKTRSSQVLQFLGEVYQNAGDRMDRFIKTGALTQMTDEVKLAQAVLGDETRVGQLRDEWERATPGRTNSVAYRDALWRFAWERYEESVARRGRLSTPNLFMTRGRLLVNQGKFTEAIPEFQKALGFAQTSSYEVIRQEGTTHAFFAIGVAYWHLGQYQEAEQWLLKAQVIQKQSGQLWIPDLDQQVERIKALARPR